MDGGRTVMPEDGQPVLSCLFPRRPCAYAGRIPYP